MLYTEQSVRDNIRNREGRRVFYLGAKDTLTPGARDYLSQQKIPILPAEQAAAEEYQLLGGGTIREKPEHLTHLHGHILVPKTHPRIAFRGAIDSLEAELLLCDCPKFTKELSEILDLSRQLIRCEVLDQPLELPRLCGLTEAELRARSHRPQDYYGQPHFMPEPTDRPDVLRLNKCRCAARQAELAAAQAFTDAGGCTRPDILQALNRMSSMIYILMTKAKQGGA